MTPQIAPINRNATRRQPPVITWLGTGLFCLGIGHIVQQCIAGIVAVQHGEVVLK